MDKKSALGKGLGSLIRDNVQRNEVPGKKLLEISLVDIMTNPNQPRKLFSKGAIDELAQSIEEKGILQPLLVRPIGGGKYELIAGERRYRASKQVGLEKVPVVIKDIDETETLELALIENIQRENLNVIEEALAYKDLLSKFQYTQDELAKRLGKDRSSIANTLRLLKLSDKIRNQLINNDLSMGHARALLSLDDKDLQIQIAQDIVENQLSVRETEGLIKKYKNAIKQGETTEKEELVVEKKTYEEILSLEKRMKELLKTYVQIKGNPNKGKITINYQNEEELKQICNKLMQ